eukprot:8336100-Heterocapsa_arctica.AAC.1
MARRPQRASECKQKQDELNWGRRAMPELKAEQWVDAQRSRACGQLQGPAARERGGQGPRRGDGQLAI